MLFWGTFWLGLLFFGADNIAGYFSGHYGSKFGTGLSSKLPLQINCSHGVPIPPINIEKSFTRDEERRVLLRFYNETSGHNWTKQEPGWRSYDNGTEIDHCHWAGIKCDKESGYIIGLTLNNNNLTGRVPNFLWKLRNLMLLCLSDNPGLQGELKDVVFQNMSKLLRIDLAFCSLSGTLPNDLFSALKSLVKIQLCCQKSKARIYNGIPPSITHLKDLRVLSLGENCLSGPIPKTIGKLTKVWFLDLEFMYLSGNISDFLGMKSLEKMHLSQAGINGDFPDNFGTCFRHLKECQLRHNSITGFIPTSVKEMKNLTKLILCGNILRGKIPKELGELHSLRILDLSDNSDLKSIEEGLHFHDSPNLEIVVLRHNPSLSARFEDLISALTLNDTSEQSALRIIDISYCDFTGSIPPGIWTFASLIELNLNHNRISGKIPAVLDDLIFLTYADFSYNPLLEGTIPDNFILLQSLRVLDIRKNPKMRAPIGSVNESSGVVQKIMRINPNSRMKGDNYSCPYFTILSNNGDVFLDSSYYYKRFCVCDHGFFGYLGRCKKCIPGGDCPDKSFNSVNPIIYLNIKKGYWPCPSADNVHHLIRCPGQRNIANKDLPCNPTGVCKCWVNASSPVAAGRVRIVCNKSCICYSGSTDKYCSKCEKNYFKSGYLCKKCVKPSLSYYFVIPLVIFCLLALWGVFKFFKDHIQVKFWVAAIEFLILGIMRAMEILSGWIFEVSVVVVLFCMAGIIQSTRGLVSILVFHIQLLDALISNTETPFPQSVYSVQHYMSGIFNLNFLGISCSLHILFNPLGKYLVIVLFPMGCLFLIWIYYGIRWIISRFPCNRNEEQERPSTLENIKFQCQKVSITCLILTYFPVMKHTLAVISPCDQDKDTAPFMRLAPWIKCDSQNTTYEALKILGWLAMIIYGLSELVALLVLLRWYKYYKGQFSEEQKKACDSWLGSIYLPYKKEVQGYFEVLKMFRKLLIATLLTFFSNTSSIQTFTIALVLMISLVYQIKIEPYDTDHEAGRFGNHLEALSLFSLQCSVILLRFASYDSHNRRVIIWTVISFNALVLVSFLVAISSVIINICSTSSSGDSPERRPLLQGGNGNNGNSNGRSDTDA